MLLSDRDIRAAIAEGRLGIEPHDAGLVQPSSIDVRLDRYFRVFNNARYTHIDPAQQQDDLTTAVETQGDEPFVLHPGEFVLGSTLEVVRIPDDLAARLEGKALAIETSVPTPTGWTTMGELAVGDEVFDGNGLPCRVVAATEVMLGRPCREVELSDGSVFTADAAHLWVTTTKNERRPGRPRRAAARTTDEVARTLLCGDERNHRIALAGPAQYPTADLPVDPYVLGYWLGDGTSSKGEITVGRGDEEVLAHFEAGGYRVWPATAPSAYRLGGTVRGDGHAHRRGQGGRFGSNGSLSSHLRALGLLGDKRVPAAYLTADVHQRLALLQGLMDSDGYVDDQGRCEFVNVREDVSWAVHELAASLGLRPTRRKKRAMLNGIDCGPAFQVEFTPRIPVFRLARKLARLKTDGRGHQHRSVRAVRPVPTVPVRCIQVSAPSGMFLVGDSYVPTHNSSLGRLGLLTHSTAGFVDPGFSGHITLELSNVANLPITLWPGMKIGQLCLFRLTSAAEHPYGSALYGSRYQDQRGPTPSRSFRNFTRAETRRPQG
ncbi:deoxycytidine triphosphate deaminase [Geodermatophilus bullaregiensis]|uniref:dCTP deaminase n=1 Tax=Geodermatophilus bullaregiensis TaxID=1564160 RepID=UPI001EF7AEB0|nr:deoxycytidine triphosphate deaminase [Geodermatophilus bullaregiensis]